MKFAALPPTVHTFSRYFQGFASCRSLGTGAAGASTAWPAANRALYVPMIIPFDFPVARVFWGNGSSVTGTGCFGIYGLNGMQLFTTGAVTKAGASAIQYVDNTDFLLPAGEYYFALEMSATTNAGWGHTTAGASQLRMSGVLQEASDGTLPATMTPAAVAASGHFIFGVSRI